MDRSEAIDELNRQKCLAEFLQNAGGDWARLESVFEHLEKDGVLIGRYMSQCPDCAGSNLEWLAAFLMEENKNISGVCYYQDPLETFTPMLRLQFFSTANMSVYGGVNKNYSGYVKDGNENTKLKNEISKFLNSSKLNFDFNEKFQEFDIQGPWDFKAQNIYSQDQWVG